MSPSFDSKGGAKTDWSYSAQKRKKLEEAAADCKQGHITDFFEILDEIARLVEENDHLSTIIKSIKAEKKTPSAAGFELDSEAHITPVLRRMTENATNNIGKGLKRRRHTVIMKKFATLLYINAGSMAYNFIHRNIPEALLLLRTIQGIVQSQYQLFYEGYFRFDELIIHLKKHNAPLLVVSEDATRIIKSVEYDPHTNRCVGFVLPSAVNGQVNADAFTVTLFEDIERYFAQNEIAKYACVHSATPKRRHSFILSCLRRH